MTFIIYKSTKTQSFWILSQLIIMFYTVSLASVASVCATRDKSTGHEPNLNLANLMKIKRKIVCSEEVDHYRDAKLGN
jgi:hypothetical protein